MVKSESGFRARRKMTQQYQQNNINSPRGSRTVTENTMMTLDDDLVVVETAGGAVTITLPRASQIPGQKVVVKASDAGSSGNPVTVQAAFGENIDSLPSVDLTEDQASVCLESDGENWRQVCGGAGGDSCCAPILGPFLGFEVDGSGTTFVVPDANETPALPGTRRDYQIQVPDAGANEMVVTIDVLKMDDPNTTGATVEIVGNSWFNTPTVGFTTIVFQDGGPGNFDRLILTLDVSNVEEGEWGSVVLTNDCGCCTSIPIGRQVAE